MVLEKTPIPEVEASDDRLGSPILSPEEEPRDLLLDRVYSDSEEEREYQVSISYIIKLCKKYILDIAYSDYFKNIFKS